MKLAIIVATAKNGVIGRNNQLPWHLPQDLKYFKAVTFGKPIIMGRKTYESIGRPLPGRLNIVVTRDKTWQAAEGVIVSPSIEAALEAAKKAALESSAGGDEAMVIGGAEIYRATLGLADKLYVTLIKRDYEGDSWFPELQDGEWTLESVTDGDAAAEIPHEFRVYRKSGQALVSNG